MSIVTSKGIANMAASYNSDRNNISNTNNQIIFNKVMSNQATSPSFDYLLNYQTIRLNDVKSILEYNLGNLSLVISENLKLEEISDERTIELPSAKIGFLGKADLLHALKKRRSIRHYAKKGTTLKELAYFLKYSVGVKEQTENMNGYEIPLRYYGSGGGLYPIRTYIMIENIKNVKKGIYQYQPFSHSIRKIEHEDIQLEDVFTSQQSLDLKNAAFAIFFVYEVNKNYVKYGEAALAYAFIEVGLMSQNMHLLAQSMDLGTCDIGGFNKVKLEKTMKLCGVNRHILYSILAGKVDYHVEI